MGYTVSGGMYAFYPQTPYSYRHDCGVVWHIHAVASGKRIPGADPTHRADFVFSKVGSGTYRKFGFSVYRATLWAPDGKWDPAKPYALELHYTRSVSKDTLVDTVADDIRDQNVADEATLVNWEKNA